MITTLINDEAMIIKSDEKKQVNGANLLGLQASYDRTKQFQMTQSNLPATMDTLGESSPVTCQQWP
jgi:hypothetical protein